jgi:uncharacterized damage-inducible protein DinB
MPGTHPIVLQLRFTRSEFMRAIRRVDDVDARRRIEPMNCISWNVGHLAWQEQRYFVSIGQERTPYPDIEKRFASGGPASTPPLDEVMAAWRAITAEADLWLDTLTTEMLEQHPIRQGKPLARIFGNLLQRTIYHYWYHTGENMAIRQQLGHERLPQFVGNIDDEAPYRPEASPS